MRSGAERVVSGALRRELFSRVGGYSSQKGVSTKWEGRSDLSCPLSFAGMQAFAILGWGKMKMAVRFGRLPSSSGTPVLSPVVRSTPRSLAGKPLAGFRATPDRRIIVLYGMTIYVIRVNDPLVHL